MTILLNYAHPLTDNQLHTLNGLIHVSPKIRDVATHIDRQQPLAEVARSLADAAHLSPTEWQTLPIILNPPSLAPLALALIAEIHGRCGYFLPIVNVRPAGDSLPPHYEIAEVVNLQRLRDEARVERNR